MKKRGWSCLLASLLLALSLTACGQSAAPEASAPAETETQAQVQTQTISGVVNRKGDFLVLLTDDGEYQPFSFGDGVSGDGLEEGDSVTITYTGTLGDENNTPTAVAIEKQ